MVAITLMRALFSESRRTGNISTAVYAYRKAIQKNQVDQGHCLQYFFHVAKVGFCQRLYGLSLV